MPPCPIRVSQYCILVGVVSAATLVACSSSSSNPSDAQASVAMCSSPGAATPGTADTHCQGMPAQTVSQDSCHTATDAGADAGAPDDECPYGATMFGHQGDDDDCKYRVSWTSTPICEGFPGVNFTVTLTSNTDGSPVTNLPASEGIIVEAFIPTDPNADCDTMSTHATPSTTLSLFETSATSGVYSGNIVLDKAGDWTVRFHIHEECDDVQDDSPHGHAAFRVTVP